MLLWLQIFILIVVLQRTNHVSSNDHGTMIQERRVIARDISSSSSSLSTTTTTTTLNKLNHLRKRKKPSSTQLVKDEHIPTETTRQLTTSLSDIFSLYEKLKDEPEDADSDDYYKEEFLLSNNQTFFNNTGDSFWMWNNQTTTSWSNIIPKSSKVKSTQWYELSHYVEPDSITYDVIEGFLVALLVCLIVTTCYTYCYYYCLTRCGLVEDDRIYKSVLHRKGRKVRELLLSRRRGRRSRLQRLKRNKKRKKKEMNTKNAGKKNCCSFSSLCCWKNQQDNDEYHTNGDRSLFAPLNDDENDYEDENSSDDESLDDWNSDSDNSSSSLSQDSALSLEYGDKETFHDDYQGENNERLTDTKLEDAAKSFFKQQEKQEQMKKNTKVGIILTKEQKRKMKKSGGIGARSIGSRRSRRSRGTSARSQASSILSSESGSLSSFNDGSSSEEGDDHSLEMESAMMDLELAQKMMGGTVV